jgi:hypothetical protein
VFVYPSSVTLSALGQVRSGTAIRLDDRALVGDAAGAQPPVKTGSR